MNSLAIAKVFITDDEDLIVCGDSENVDEYIDDLYKSNCIRKDIGVGEFDSICDHCESLMIKGGMQECPVLVTSHEVNLSEIELDELLEDYRKDLAWAEVISL